MSASVLEREIGSSTLDVLPAIEQDVVVDEVREGIQMYLGQDTLLVDYDAQLRKDYYGPASRKIQIGGALLVFCNVEVENEPRTLEVEVNDTQRPFSETVITKLGALAQKNWYLGRGRKRDYAS